VTLLAVALAVHAILLESVVVTWVLAALGLLLAVMGAAGLRTELAAIARRRRAEIALFTLGVIGILMAIAYLSVRYPVRFDLTSTGAFSLSAPTITMLKRLDRPVHIAFFHDPM